MRSAVRGRGRGAMLRGAWGRERMSRHERLARLSQVGQVWQVRGVTSPEGEMRQRRQRRRPSTASSPACRCQRRPQGCIICRGCLRPWPQAVTGRLTRRSHGRVGGVHSRRLGSSRRRGLAGALMMRRPGACAGETRQIPASVCVCERTQRGMHAFTNAHGRACRHVLHVHTTPMGLFHRAEAVCTTCALFHRAEAVCTTCARGVNV